MHQKHYRELILHLQVKLELDVCNYTPKALLIVKMDALQVKCASESIFACLSSVCNLFLMVIIALQVNLCVKRLLSK